MSEIRDQYGKYMAERARWLENRIPRKYYEVQETRYVHPFRLYGNVWYVGDNWVCVHLIDTGDGLLLIDAGNCGAVAMLVNAIWEAGFNPADVKWIVLSHGHLDHFGACNFFRRMFGTKIYMGKPDCENFRNRPELSFIQDTGNLADTLFEIDHEIEDGEVLNFGNTEMTFYLCPGHTDGVIATFFDVDGPEGMKRAGYFGGFGHNTLTKEYLQDIGDTSYEMRNRFLNSLQRVRNERVELFLGNHCSNNDTLGNMEKLKANPDRNPFVDEERWGRYMDERIAGIKAFMADPANS